MTIQAAPRVWTDEEALALPKDGYDHEIIDGEEVMTLASVQHGAIIMRIAAALYLYAKQNDLGTVVDGQTGCRLSPSDLVSPDVSFIEESRWKAYRAAKTTFFQGSPDLVVEVLSPDETPRRVKRKVDLYFAHGARLAWIVHPRNRTVDVYRQAAARTTLAETASLDGADVLPGFTLPLKDLFLD